MGVASESGVDPKLGVMMCLSKQSGGSSLPINSVDWAVVGARDWMREPDAISEWQHHS